MTDLPTGTVTFLFTDIEVLPGCPRCSATGTRRSWTPTPSSSELARAAGSRSAPTATPSSSFRSPAGAKSAGGSPPSGPGRPRLARRLPVRVRMGCTPARGAAGTTTPAWTCAPRLIADAAHGGQVLLSDASSGAWSSTPCSRAPPARPGRAPPARPRRPRAPPPARRRRPGGRLRRGPGRPAEQPPPAHLVRGPEEEIVEVERLLGQTRC